MFNLIYLMEIKMKFDFKKWVKGDNPEENAKLAKIDSEFGKLIDLSLIHI